MSEEKIETTEDTEKIENTESAENTESTENAESTADDSASEKQQARHELHPRKAAVNKASSAAAEAPAEQKAEAAENTENTENADQDSKAAESSASSPENSEAEKTVRKKINWKRVALATAGILTLAAVGGYLGVAIYYTSHFLPNTIIDGVDYSGETVKAADERRTVSDNTYTLTLNGREGTQAVLSSDSLGFNVIYSLTMEEIKAKQNALAWGYYYFNNNNYSLDRTISYNSASIANTLASVQFLQAENMKAPENAYIGDYSTEAGAYVITPEYVGTTVDMDILLSSVENAVSEHSPVLDLDAAGCYTEAEVKSDDEELAKELSVLNKYQDTVVTYDLCGEYYDIDFDLIHDWMVVSGNSVSIDKDKVQQFVEKFAEENDTYGLDEDFTTVDGYTLTLPKGRYGWKLDVETETEQLYADVVSGNQVTREPAFSCTAAQWGKSDIGDTYIEVCLTDQKVYLIEEGVITYECDCVTGCVAKGNSTPVGIYGVTYKQKDAVLRGPGYASPVKYWMPFNRGIGLHDASWRGKFGGTIYKYSGSHGCVNIPKDAAAFLYEKVYRDFPVIVYSVEEARAEEAAREAAKATATPTPTATATPTATTAPTEITTPEPTIDVTPEPTIEVTPEPTVEVTEIPTEPVVTEVTVPTEPTVPDPEPTVEAVPEPVPEPVPDPGM
ncbi:MAG: peptidoglycan binding domain-containing protein [Lachnospiraceae bacterium]|nr:peptidoglycan binding domain-containing protein [Lachnospiraceae bacterium]